MENLSNAFTRAVSLNPGRGHSSRRGHAQGPPHATQGRATASANATNTNNQPTQPPRVPLPPSIPPLSSYSSNGVSNCAWSSQDFMLGAGMVIFQQNTHKIVVVHDTQTDSWFFPRGRKDTWESLEQTALREAYEESGYRVEFLQIYNPHRQPSGKDTEEYDRRVPLCIEPIYMTITPYFPKKLRNGGSRPGGQYLTTWYAGRIDEDAIAESGTGMPDEQNYKSHLMPYEEAMKKLHGDEKMVLTYAWELFQCTMKYYNELAKSQEQGADASNHQPTAEEQPTQGGEEATVASGP